MALVSLLALSGLVMTAGVTPWTLLADALYARLAGMMRSPAATVPDSPDGTEVSVTPGQIDPLPGEDRRAG